MTLVKRQGLNLLFVLVMNSLSAAIACRISSRTLVITPRNSSFDRDVSLGISALILSSIGCISRKSRCDLLPNILLKNDENAIIYGCVCLS